MAFDDRLTADQRDLQQRCRDTFRAIRDRRPAPDEDPGSRLDEIWSALAQVGYPGLLVPERYGGRDSGLLSAALVMEELAAQDLQSFAPVLLAMASTAVSRFGSEELKSEILPRLSRGEARIAIASTEREAGFNVLNARTAAERHGDHFRVNGSKIYVSGIDVADQVLLVTRTTPREECARRGLSSTAGLTLLLADTAGEGIEWTPLRCRGECLLRQFAVELRELRVPLSRVVGEPDDGAKPMFHMFNPERTLAAAMAVGISRYCLELACEHARRRKVFGETPIGAYQAVQHPLADVAARQDAARLMVHRAAALFDREADVGEQAASANAAKYLASELAVLSVDAAIDAFGGKGFDEQHGIIHLWEAARLLKTSPISNALILNQIAVRELGLPRSY